MNQLSKLIRVQIGIVFNANQLFHMREKKSQNNKMISVLALLLFGLLFALISGVYSFLLGTAFKEADALYLLPVLMMFVTSFVILFTTIYKVKGILFGFKDYDLVMSLPVSTGAVVASRVFLLYVFQMACAAIILIPANVVYGILASASPLFYVMSTILVLVVPILPMVVATLLGLIISVIASNFKHNNLVNLVLLIVVTLGIMCGSSAISSMSEDSMAVTELFRQIMDQINCLYPMANLYLKAVVNTDMLSFIGVLAINLVVLWIYCLLVGVNFKKVNTAMTAHRSNSNYKMKELSSSGVLKALYNKEIKRYFACPMYVMNTAIGMILMTIMIVVLAVSGQETLADMLDIPGMADSLKIFAPGLLGFCVALSCTTAPSISLEGNNLWILKEAPLDPFDIFMSKILVNLTITVPLTILNALILGWIMKLSLGWILITLVFPISITFFISTFGVILNLKFPRFDWKSEMEVVKQGAPMLIAMLTGMLVSVLPIGAVILLGSSAISWIYVAFTVILSIMTVGVYHYLLTRGRQKFMKL